MTRKILSLIITVAMVFTLFSGVVLAGPLVVNPDVEIDIDEMIANLDENSRLRRVVAEVDEDILDAIEADAGHSSWREDGDDYVKLAALKLDKDGEVAALESDGINKFESEELGVEIADLDVRRTGDEELTIWFDDNDAKVHRIYGLFIQANVEYNEEEEVVGLGDSNFYITVEEDDSKWYPSEDVYFEYKFDIELDYDAPEVGESFTVEGTIVDAQGDEVETRDEGFEEGEAEIYLKAEGNSLGDEPFDSTKSRSNGNFWLNIVLDTTKDLQVGVWLDNGSSEFFVYEEIGVGAFDLEISVSPDNFIYGLKDFGTEVIVEFTVEYDGENVLDSDSDLFDVAKETDNNGKLKNVTFTIEDGEKDGETLDNISVNLDDEVYEWDVTELKFTEEQDFTIEVVIQDGAEYYEGEVEIEVTEPEDMNVVALPDVVEVKDYMDGGLDGWFIDGWFVVRENSGLEGFDAIELFIEGPGISIEWDEDEWTVNDSDSDVMEVKDGSDVLASYNTDTGEVKIKKDFQPEQAGEIEVKIVAYEKDNGDAFGDEVDTYETVIEVDGYFVEFSETRFQVDEEYDFTITLTDTLGRPMNNATVIIETEGESEVDKVCSSDDYIFDGEYVFEEFEHDEVEDLKVKVKRTNGDVKAYFTKGISVIGEETLTIELVDAEGLVAGVENDLVFVVLDEDGEPIEAEEIEIFIDDEDEDAAEYTEKSTDVDYDGDEYTVEDLIAAESVVIYAYGEDRKEYGVKEVVVDLGVELTPEVEALTDKYTQEFNLELFDPFTDDEIEFDEVTLELEDAFVYCEDDEEFKTELTIEVDEGKFSVLVYADEDDDAEPTVTLYVELDKAVEIAEFMIADATVNFTPEQVVRNASTYVEVELLNTAGEPLAGYAVTMDGDVELETDVDGIVDFDVFASTRRVVFEFETCLDKVDMADEDEIEDLDAFKVELDVIRDTEGPEVSYPATTDENIATITVSDVSGVDQIFLDGEMIFFPQGPEWMINVDLELGVNTFTVWATDAHGNRTVEEVAIDYVLGGAGQIVMELDADTVTVDGVTETLEVAPFVENGRTLVPFRWIVETLGGSVDYVPAERKVVAAHGDTVIEFTLDSTTAIVNGEAVELDAAPTVVSGRTVLPARFTAETFGAHVGFLDGVITITQ